MTAKTNELISLAPLNLEQLKVLLPEVWYGMKRTAVTTSNAEGYSVAEGNYKKDSNTNIKVMIYDCAGEAGATAYTLTYWGAINAQQESEKDYTRTIDFKGGKAIEEFKKDVNAATLTYVSNGRLLIVLEARNLEPSELKEAAQRLHFKL
ncbi:MAG TPA: hypothetical protein VM871_10675, partial [Flavisolibacter sp.]|nr:hypothetical protein [Flavisolibacter sp.]